MNIFVSGINYKTAPLKIREKLSFSKDELQAALKEIYKISDVSECIMICTCNRTEVYIYSENKNFNFDMIESLLCNIKDLDIYSYKKYFIFYEGIKAVRHLFKVACGLDSLILGEDQILGQVKDAHEQALDQKTSSVVLNTLFREAVTAAKKIKTCTGVSKSPVSAGSMAVRLLGDEFENQFEDKCALLIGMGKIGTIALKSLIGKGIGRIYITNRSHGKVDNILKDYSDITHVDYNDRYSVINEADIIISSTSSPHYTITRDMLEQSIRNFKPRVFIDLAVPRDIDASIEEIPGVEYYNIDDLKVAVDESLDQRLKEVPKAQEIIDECVKEYEKWYGLRDLIPIMRHIQKYTEDFVELRISQTLEKLNCLSSEDKDTVTVSIRSVANNFLDKFVYRVRDNSSKEELETYFKCMSEAIKEEGKEGKENKDTEQ